MNSWLRVLLDPRPIVRQAYRQGRPYSIQQLLAVLLMGDLAAFARLSTDSGFQVPGWLAGFATTRRPNEVLALPLPPEDQQLLDHILLYVAGRPKAGQALSSLLDDQIVSPNSETDRAAILGILAALALRETDAPWESVDALARIPLARTSDYGRAAIELHRASILAEAASSTNGAWRPYLIQPTSEPSDVWYTIAITPLLPDKDAPSSGIRLDVLLRGVAQRCAATLPWNSKLAIWNEAEQLIDYRRDVEKEHGLYLADLGEVMLSKNFEISTESGQNRRVLLGGPSDKTADTLSKALLRSRCVADHAESIYLSRLLARHQISQTFGSFESDPASAALDTLVRAGDEKGVRRSAWVLWTAGPQLALKRVGERVAADLRRQQDFSRLSDASIQLLRIAGDLFSAEFADEVARICLVTAIDERQTSAPMMDIVRVAASVAGSASDEAQTTLANIVLAGNRERADDSFFRKLAHQIRWVVVDPSTQETAIEWCRNVTGNDDSYSAQAVLEELATGATETQALRAIRSAVRRNRTLGWAGALWNAANRVGSLRETDLDLIQQICLSDIQSIREQASRNRYNFGSRVQAAGLLARLGIFAGRSNIWDPLVEYLLDPDVQLSDKTESLEVIARNLDRVPARLKRKIRKRLSALSSVSPFEQMESSAYLREEGVGGLGVHTHEQLVVGVAVQALTRAECLSAIAELTASGLTSDRSSATSVLGLIARRSSQESLVSLTLALCSDNSAEVRADALLALAWLRPVARWQKPAVMRALKVGLRTPGILVPLRTLNGLLQEPLRDDESDLANDVQRLLSHSSAKVRNAASSVLSEMQSRAGGSFSEKEGAD